MKADSWPVFRGAEVIEWIVKVEGTTGFQTENCHVMSHYIACGKLATSQIEPELALLVLFSVDELDVCTS